MSRRTEMLASTIQRELAMMILHHLNDPRITGMPSITRVKISPDLSLADVYVTVMGTPGQQTAALNALKHSAGMMRSRLTKSLTLRTTPFISFHFDEQLKKELDVLNALRKVSEENAELDRKRAAAARGTAEVTPTDRAQSEIAGAATSASEPELATHDINGSASGMRAPIHLPEESETSGDSAGGSHDE